jgi:hypothetical protein
VVQTQRVISRHIGNIFKDDEVDKKSNMQKMHIANSDKPVNTKTSCILLFLSTSSSLKILPICLLITL